MGSGNDEDTAVFSLVSGTTHWLSIFSTSVFLAVFEAVMTQLAEALNSRNPDLLPFHISISNSVDHTWQTIQLIT